MELGARVGLLIRITRRGIKRTGMLPAGEVASG